MGYSLLEMLVVMVIVGALMTHGLPSLSMTTERVALQAQLETWLLFLHERQALAMQQRQSVRVPLDTFAARQLPDHWHFSHNFRRASPLRFEGASGFARPGSLRIGNDSATVKIIISGLGRIRACQISGASLAWVKPC